MPKIQPPELKKFMDKKLSGELRVCSCGCHYSALRELHSLQAQPSVRSVEGLFDIQLTSRPAQAFRHQSLETIFRLEKILTFWVLQWR